MSLPKGLTKEQMETTWAAQLDPVIDGPLAKAVILKNVSLVAGSNVVNHKLGRRLEGWNPTRVRGVVASIYDTQDSNKTPHLTLNLVSSAAVVVDLLVF